jgi:hypothetical protein
MKNLQEDYENWRGSTDSDRKQLKEYFNVEFPPVYVKHGQENVEVSFLYPPPQLHAGVLGPGNDALELIGEHVDAVPFKEFKNKYHIRGGGPGGDLNGPTLKKLMKNKDGSLDELEELVRKENKDLTLVINHLKNLNRLNGCVNLKKLDLDECEQAIFTLKTNFQEMQEIFNVSETLKMHILCDHYMDHLELTGETLLETTDETIESVHGKFRKFIYDHGQYSNKVGSGDHRRKQHWAVVAWNSLNVGDL